MSLVILGAIAGAGIWLSNEVATGTSVGGIIALSMKILESD
jgi:patatin-like phospholipase/acyl hydrolase